MLTQGENANSLQKDQPENWLTNQWPLHSKGHRFNNICHSVAYTTSDLTTAGTEQQSQPHILNVRRHSSSDISHFKKKKSLVSVRGISHSSCKNHVNLNLWNDNKKPSPLHKKKTLQKKRSSDKNHPCTGSYLVETHDILRRTASKDWGENRFLREMGLVSGLRVANAGQNGTDLTRWAAVVCLDLPSTLDRLRGFLFLPTKDTNK